MKNQINQRKLLIQSYFLALLLTPLASGLAQNVVLNGARLLEDGKVQISFTGQEDSYYVLRSRLTLESTNSSPVAARLGNGGEDKFERAPLEEVEFLMLERWPTNGTNDLDGDRLPDAWELERPGFLNPLDASDARTIAPRDTRSWLDVFLQEGPRVSFKVSNSTISADSSSLLAELEFSRPFTGRVYYQVFGSAIPSSTGGVNGDYLPGLGFVNVTDSVDAVVPIRLIPSPSLELERNLILSLSTAPALTPTKYTIGRISTHQVRIVPGEQTYLGSLVITNGLFIQPQSMKMAVRNTGTGMEAVFDVTGSPLLGDTFTVPLTVPASGFQFAGSLSRLITNAALSRPLALTLAFGATRHDEAETITPVALTVSGLTASGTAITGQGALKLNRTR